MFWLIKLDEIIRLLTDLFYGSNYTNFVLSSNQKFNHDLTYPYEYSQEFHYYSFAIKLGRCVVSCNTYVIKYMFQIKQKI